VFIVVELKNVVYWWNILERVLSRIKSTADYQFGKGIGAKLFPDNVDIMFSKATGRIRYIYLNGERLATLRPTDGLFSLSIIAAQLLAENRDSAKCFVTVQNDISKFIADGGDAFAMHVITADDEIQAKDEVIILDENHHVLAVGRAMLSADEMKAFKTGVAVKIRRGCSQAS